MEQYIYELNQYDLEQVWSGYASEVQQEEYNRLLGELIKCSEDVKKYEEALVLKAKYEELSEKIMILRSEISSCSCHNRDEGECGACGQRIAQIAQLDAEREATYNQITEILSHFNVEIPSYGEIVSYEVDIVRKTMDGLEFPLYNQMDYDGVEYHSNRTIAEEGCGITCAAMVISAYTGQQITPDMLASQIEWDGNDTTLNRALNAYGIKNANNNFLVASPNSKYEYIDDGLTEIGKNAIYYDEVKQKISEGYVAIFQMNEGVFTNGSHFVLVTGLTEDGNFIIQDPNGNNYVPTGSTDSQILQNGFENGFTDDDIRGSWSGCYLIEPYEDYLVRNTN